MLLGGLRRPDKGKAPLDAEILYEGGKVGKGGRVGRAGGQVEWAEWRVRMTWRAVPATLPPNPPTHPHTHIHTFGCRARKRRRAPPCPLSCMATREGRHAARQPWMGGSTWARRRCEGRERGRGGGTPACLASPLPHNTRALAHAPPARPSTPALCAPLAAVGGWGGRRRLQRKATTPARRNLPSGRAEWQCPDRSSRGRSWRVIGWVGACRGGACRRVALRSQSADRGPPPPPSDPPPTPSLPPAPQTTRPGAWWCWWRTWISGG